MLFQTEGRHCKSYSRMYCLFINVTTENYLVYEYCYGKYMLLRKTATAFLLLGFGHGELVCSCVLHVDFVHRHGQGIFFFLHNADKAYFFITTSVYCFVCKAHEMQAFIFPAQTQVNTKFCFHVQKLIRVKHDCSRLT
jgi:hypothetical protein